MRRRSLLALSLLSAPVLTAAMAHAEPDVGAVSQEEFRGAMGQRVAAQPRQLLFRGPVYADETVRTGEQGSTAMQFLDDTRLQVGANATVVLDRFVYDPKQHEGELALSLGKGVFRFVTGHMPKPSIAIKTPSASIAVRGTRAIIHVDLDNTTTVYVIDGLILFGACDGQSYQVGGRQSARVLGDCSGSQLVAGRLVPQDPAVEQDVPLLAEATLPPPPPGSEMGQRDRNQGDPSRGPARSSGPSDGGDSGDGGDGGSDGGDGGGSEGGGSEGGGNEGGGGEGGGTP
jgi:hypothetical protein